MTILTREAILSAQDLKTETVKVPEWGGEVIVSMMTAATRDAWEMSLVGDGKTFNTSNMSARLLAHCAIDEKGNRLFTDKDAEALGKRSARAMSRCVKVIQRLNGLTDADIEAAKGN
jgi:hypothetical protein